jgi:RimJ/RimL family protein N-acetyltransferase
VFQEILTDRLRLRRLQVTDAGRMFAYRSHPQVLLYQSWAPTSLEEVQAFIDRMSVRELDAPGWFQLGISERADDNLIGDCGVRFLETDSRLAEIGITIAPPFQGNGYAAEALNFILDLLFVTLGKHRVFACVDPRNCRSIALMKRLGLRQEAHFIQSHWFKESWVDDTVFAMLADEWCVKQSTGDEPRHASQEGRGLLGSRG